MDSSYACKEHLDVILTTFGEAVNHRIKEHPEEKIKVTSKYLSHTTGKLVLKSKEFDIIPAKCPNIFVDSSNEKIKIQPKLSELDTETEQLETDISRQEELMKLIKELAPGVCKFLATQDPIHADRIISFLCLLNSESFPLDNICYLMFCDLIQWLSLDDKRQMTYTADVKNFWFICKVLFKEKCLTFFRGETGRLNFPVPRSCENRGLTIPDNLEPGLLRPMMDAYSANRDGVSFNLSCDLKGINPSKVDPLGGVDLAGFEPSPTRQELSDQLQFELKALDVAMELADSALNNHGIDFNRNELIQSLRQLIKISSSRVRGLRNHVAGKEYAVAKLLMRANEEKTNDWTKTRYVNPSIFKETEGLATCLLRLLASDIIWLSAVYSSKPRLFKNDTTLIVVADDIASIWRQAILKLNVNSNFSI